MGRVEGSGGLLVRASSLGTWQAWVRNQGEAKGQGGRSRWGSCGLLCLAAPAAVCRVHPPTTCSPAGVRAGP